jgi:hypothetical protein
MGTCFDADVLDAVTGERQGAAAESVPVAGG